MKPQPPGIAEDTLAPARALPWPPFLLSLLLLLTVSLSAGASVPAVQLTGEDRQPLGSGLVYHIDAEDQLDAATIAAAPDRVEWTRSPDAVPSLGLMPDPVWFALVLENPREMRRFLSIAYPPLDNLDIYLIRDGEIVLEQKTGDHLPFDSRPINHRDFVIPLELAAETDYLLLMRVQTTGALQMPVALWEPDRFMEEAQHNFALQMLFIGIMAALAIYNLLLYLVVRDRAYLWYVTYLVSFLIAQMTLRGLGFQYLWPDRPGFNDVSLPLLLSISLAAVGFFTHNFLNVRHYSRLWSRIILTIGWAGVVLAALSLVLPYGTVIALMMGPVVIGATLVFIGGCYLWWRGQVLARFYVIAWSLFLLGNILFTLSKAGILPQSTVADHMVQVGAVLQMLLLSFALAYRINLERQQRQAAQEHALIVQRDANEKLESRVRERTDELREAYEKLKEMSQLDGLTQLKNRQFFDQSLETEWRRNTREVRQISLLMLDVDHFKEVNDTLGHLCGDACLRHLAQICQNRVHRASDIVARYGGEEFVLLLPCTELEGAAIVAERIREDILEGDFQWEGKHIPLSVSIGVAGCIPDRERQFEWLVKHADQALYAAKNGGRNRTMVAQEGEDGEIAVVAFRGQGPLPQ